MQRNIECYESFNKRKTLSQDCYEMALLNSMETFCTSLPANDLCTYLCVIIFLAFVSALNFMITGMLYAKQRNLREKS